MSLQKTFFRAIIIAFGICMPVPADDWPQWRGPGRDGVWREEGIIERFDTQQLPVRWRAEISNGYSGPTVADGRVYVTDRLTTPVQVERVHCFDATTGEKIWSHDYKCKYERIDHRNGPRAARSATIVPTRLAPRDTCFVSMQQREAFSGTKISGRSTRLGCRCGASLRPHWSKTTWSSC
jgi:hypothetical protein